MPAPRAGDATGHTRFPPPPRHQLLEHGIDRLKQRLSTSEVVLHVDDSAGLPGARGKPLLTPEKSLRLSQSKTENTLLDVTHAEKILAGFLQAFGADEPENLILNFVDILILIDQH